MRQVVVGFSFVLLFAVAWGQNRLPKEEAQRYARACVEQLGNLGDAQIKTEVDPEKVVAVRGEGGGAMIIPDKNLSKEKLAKVGKDAIPVGQVWLRKWTVVVGGKPVPSDKLRVVTVNVDGKDRPMPLLLVGVRGKAEKDLELVVYAKDSEPILTVPLKPVEFVQDLPINLEWQRGEKQVDPLTLTIFGKYQAILPITRQ
jgi:hypothetical protein